MWRAGGSPSRRAQLEHLALDRAHRRAAPAPAATRSRPTRRRWRGRPASASKSPSLPSRPAVRTPDEPLALEEPVDDLGPGPHLDALCLAAPPAAPRVSARGSTAASPAAKTPPWNEGVRPGSRSRQRARRQPLGLELERALQVVDAPQLRRLVAVERDVQRPEPLVAACSPRRRLQLGDELRVEPRRRQGQLQQLRLAEGQLADRRQHPGRDPRRAAARLAALEHRHPRPALRQRARRS